MSIINTNEILYRIQKALNLSTQEILEAYTIEEHSMEISHLESLLVRHQNKNFKLCSYEELGIFLDGLVALKRGVSVTKVPNDETVELTNNLILKKLRISLEFKDAQMQSVFALGGVHLSKQQLASLFRNPNHKNYKACSLELLIAFFDGLDNHKMAMEIK